MFPRRTKPEPGPPATPVTPAPRAGWMKYENCTVAFGVTGGALEGCTVNIGSSVPTENGKKLKKSKGAALAAAADAAKEMKGVEDAEQSRGGGGPDGDGSDYEVDKTGIPSAGNMGAEATGKDAVEAGACKDNVGGGLLNAEVVKTKMGSCSSSSKAELKDKKGSTAGSIRKGEAYSYWSYVKFYLIFFAFMFVIIVGPPFIESLTAEEDYDLWQEVKLTLKKIHELGKGR